MKKSLLITILILVANTCFLQGQKVMELRIYDKKSKEVIEAIQQNTLTELTKLTKRTEYYRDGIETSRDYFLSGLKSGKYIENDSLQRVIQEVYNKIFVSNKLLDTKPVFLISLSAEVKTLATVINVYEISLPLLLTVRNQDQLAFMMAHELAHQLMYHPAERIYRYETNKLDQRMGQEMLNGWGGGSNIENMLNIRKMASSERRSQQKEEIQADSLGLQLMIQAGFDPLKGISVLKQLGFDGYSQDIETERLLKQLFTANYPYKSDWLKPRNMNYDKVPEFSGVYRSDSVNIHPYMISRIQHAMNLIGMGSAKLPDTDFSFFSDSRGFTLLEIAMAQREYEVALYLALNLRLSFPKDSYLVARISQILLDIYQAKYDNDVLHNVYQYLHFYTSDFPKSLNDINAFLFNLKTNELPEVAYFFLNNPGTFDPSNEEHYFFMYSIADLTARASLKLKVSEMYHSRFPQGDFQAIIK